ncbi:sphinganine kinase lcb4, partial [Aspergillus brasiliensis]
PGRALRLWKNEVKPIFDAARMELHEVILDRGGEAAELAGKVDLRKYDTILACSGDGTVHEIFNGLGNRPDAGHALACMPTIGITAESDLDTEQFRWMGSTRFEFGVMTRILKRKCYPCDVALKVEIEDKASIKAHHSR